MSKIEGSFSEKKNQQRQGPSNQPMDRPTNKKTYRVTCTLQKITIPAYKDFPP